MPVMTEREIRMAMHRLCAPARAKDGTWYPGVCQTCPSACKYGTRLLHHYGLERKAPKETPEAKSSVMAAGKVKICMKGYNKYSIIRR